MDLVVLMNESNQFYAFLLSLFLCSFLYLLKLSVFRAKKQLNLPPSPPKLPIIGNLHQLGSQPHQCLRALANKYGSVMLFHFGTTPTIIVSSAEIFSELVKTDGPAFSNRPQTKGLNAIFNGCRDLAFTSYGDYWRQVKKSCLLHLLNQKKVQSFELARGDIAANMVEKIRDSCLSGAAINLSEMFLTASCDVVSRAVFGQVYERNDGCESIAELSKKGVNLLGDFCFEDVIPSLGWMDTLTGFRARLKKTSKGINDFLDQVIEEHLEEDESETKEFVDILLDIQKDHEMKKTTNFNRDNVKAIITDMFLAGSDTVALVLEWAMVELMKNPSIMKNAQEELRRVVGNKSKIEETDINQMKFLKCVIKETLRLHPAIPMPPREMTEGCKLGGYDLPPKVRVMINIWAIHRDPKYWDSPEEFIPERHENSTVDYIDQSNHFIPFGGGRRGCPGMLFAIANAESLLANILCWFDWKMPGDARGEDLDTSEVLNFVLRKKIPLNLIPQMHSR